MPTIHNPTTVTMPAARRREVAQVIHARGLTLIEDDPYSFLAPGHQPLSALVPDRSFLAASVAKCLAPGLRVSIVVAPNGSAADRLARSLRATQQMPVPLMGAIAARWMRDGTAQAIAEAIGAEAVARQTLARAALAGTGFVAHAHGLHVWLPLPPTLAAGAFAAELHGRGLAVVTADAFATDVAPPGGIRLALGAAKSRLQLARALDILSSAFMAAATGPD